MASKKQLRRKRAAKKRSRTEQREPDEPVVAELVQGHRTSSATRLRCIGLLLMFFTFFPVLLWLIEHIGHQRPTTSLDRIFISIFCFGMVSFVAFSEWRRKSDEPIVAELEDENPNPYAATSTIETDNMMPTHTAYGGIGRLAYLGLGLLNGVVYKVGLGAIESAGESAALLETLLNLVSYGTMLWFVALRMINTGYSPWLCVGMNVPFLNILVAVRAFACPAGYADHRTLDTAGKIIVGLCLAMLALFFIGLVIAIVKDAQGASSSISFSVGVIVREF